MPGDDGRQAYADGIGLHRPGILDSCQGLLMNGNTRFADTPTSTNWPQVNRAKFVRVRNSRPFMPTHGYVWSGAAGIDNWCVAIYEEETLPNSSTRNLVRIGTTGAVGSTTGSQVAFAALTMDKGLDVGDYVLALQISTAASQVGERRTGESIDYHLRNLGYTQFTPSAFPLAVSHAYGSSWSPGNTGIPIFGVIDRLF